MKHGNHDGAGSERHLHDPIEDRLVPLEPLDPTRVHSIDDLVRAMAKTAFTARQLGEAADVLEAMARDKDCFVVMTLAGAMTVANTGSWKPQDTPIFVMTPTSQMNNSTSRATTGFTTRWNRNGIWTTWSA